MKKVFTSRHINKLIPENSLAPRERAGVRGQSAFASRYLERSESSQLAFTLAEVLITLAIIGVVAAISIPSVISNAQQQEFKTGLRKAVSVLNSAITMNIALDGETPYDNGALFEYLQRHMSVMKSTSEYRAGRVNNLAFYTTDGMRFEFRKGSTKQYNLPLYEDNTKFLCYAALSKIYSFSSGNLTEYEKGLGCGGCGSYGLTSNHNNTTKVPCLVVVDVNGDRKPNPSNGNCLLNEGGCAKPYKFSSPNGKNLTDIFSIMITDEKAVPYGSAAQKAMYQAQK